jgi:hypothetical protein
MFHKKLSLWRRLVGSHEQYLLTPKIKYTYLLNDTKSLVEQKNKKDSRRNLLQGEYHFCVLLQFQTAATLSYFERILSKFLY